MGFRLAKCRVGLQVVGRCAAVIEQVERSELLGRVSASVRRPVADALEGKSVRDLLSGSRFGHPLHPALVSFPLGMWSSALVADLAGDTKTARRLSGLGLLGALPVAATGLSDWLDTSGAEQRVGLAHMGTNLVAILLVGAGWKARRAGKRRRGGAIGALGLAVAGVGGWLGGHLAYALGVGVDANAFDGGPTEWTNLSIDPPAGRASGIRAGQADGILLAVVEGGDGVGSAGAVGSAGGGPVSVLADRCSHRGGPLSGGELAGGCIRCPWHASQFDVVTGAVVHGPATEPQPVYEVRGHGDGWQVRRDEPRALRANSVRARS